MCSGVKLVKTAVSKLINLWRCCLTPSSVTSKTTYWHLAFIAFRKNLCILKRPGMVIFKTLGLCLSPILNLIEEIEATLCFACSKILAIKSTVVDFPSVPATPIILILFEGNL